MTKTTAKFMTLFFIMLFISACVSEEGNIADQDLKDIADAAASDPVDSLSEQDIETLPDEIIPEPPEKPIAEETTETLAETEDIDEETASDDYEFTLTLEKTDDSVKLTWTPFSGEFEVGGFENYKVIRSITNADPTYPGESLLKTIVDINETEYVDRLPEAGISYYRVAAIGEYKQKFHTNVESTEFPHPKETPDQDITLVAEKAENGVLLKWTRYDGEFLQYKVVMSTDHPYPKYPDDRTLETVPFQNITSYTDLTPESGTSYYAVTVIRPDRSRFTSKRVMITV
ncbi:MAG: hypothetical protein KKF44_04635 [Nanoarchaeota archaeon]|nr:hypothetical protein [Nanoarchaeota archaeon]